MKKLMLPVLLIIPALVITAQQPDPVQLMEKSRDLTMAGNLQTTLSMTIREKNGSVRTRKVAMQEKSYGGTEKRLIKFLDPADVRGTAMLIVDNEESQDEMWIYLPALKKTRRIVTTEKGKSFMSSEFSNADMASAPVSDFKIRHLPESGQDGIWQIESFPASEDKADEYGFARKVTFLDKKDLKVKKIDFYNFEGELARTIDILATQPIEGREGYLMTEMSAVNHLNGRSSLIKFEQTNTSAVIPDNVFTVENLTR